MADRAVEEVRLADLPDAAIALFGTDAFSTRLWYESTVAAALPSGAAACFQLVRHDGDVEAVFPMLRSGGRLSALTTPYTCLWHPLLAPGCDARAIGKALAPVWRRGAVVRLDCMPADAAWLQPLLRGMAAGGLQALGFDHFGNWHLGTAGLDWAGYVASRPGQLRSAINRQVRRLMSQGAAFSLTCGMDGLEEAIAAYEQVYASSWKEPEPYPAFNATLMRHAATAGAARIGVLRLAGMPIAAQFWLLHGRWASVLKLAYDEAHRALAPGNVLTALVIRHLFEHEQLGELDFGRGDDGYKQSWTGLRRPRIGVLLANPLSVAGAREIGRHHAGRMRRRFSKTAAPKDGRTA